MLSAEIRLNTGVGCAVAASWLVYEELLLREISTLKTKAAAAGLVLPQIIINQISLCDERTKHTDRPGPAV